MALDPVVYEELVLEGYLKRGEPYKWENVDPVRVKELELMGYLPEGYSLTEAHMPRTATGEILFPKETVGEAAAREVFDIGEAVTHPGRTIKQVGQGIGALVGLGLQATQQPPPLLARMAPKEYERMIQQQTEAAKTLGDIGKEMAKESYARFRHPKEEFKKAPISMPFKTLSDISIISTAVGGGFLGVGALKGGLRAGAAGTRASRLVQTGMKFIRFGDVIDPVNWPFEGLIRGVAKAPHIFARIRKPIGPYQSVKAFKKALQADWPNPRAASDRLRKVFEMEGRITSTSPEAVEQFLFMIYHDGQGEAETLARKVTQYPKVNEQLFKPWQELTQPEKDLLTGLYSDQLPQTTKDEMLKAVGSITGEDTPTILKNWVDTKESIVAEAEARSGVTRQEVAAETQAATAEGRPTPADEVRAQWDAEVDAQFGEPVTDFEAEFRAVEVEPTAKAADVAEKLPEEPVVKPEVTDEIITEAVEEVAPVVAGDIQLRNIVESEIPEVKGYIQNVPVSVENIGRAQAVATKQDVTLGIDFNQELLRHELYHHADKTGRVADSVKDEIVSEAATHGKAIAEFMEANSDLPQIAKELSETRDKIGTVPNVGGLMNEVLDMKTPIYGEVAKRIGLLDVPVTSSYSDYAALSAFKYWVTEKMPRTMIGDLGPELIARRVSIDDIVAAKIFGDIEPIVKAEVVEEVTPTKLPPVTEEAPVARTIEGVSPEQQAVMRDMGFDDDQIEAYLKKQQEGITKVKPLIEMQPAVYKATLESLKQGEKNELVQALGEEGARRYNKLQRSANALRIDPKKQDAASRELRRIEANLTPEQKMLVFGIEGIGPPSYEDYKAVDFAFEHLGISAYDDTDLYANLGREMRRVSPDEARRVFAGEEMPLKTQASTLYVMRAISELEQRGRTVEQIAEGILGIRQMMGDNPVDIAELTTDWFDAAARAEQRVGEAPTPQRPIAPTPETLTGKPHKYTHPSVPEGEQKEFDAVYKVMAANDVQPSHLEEQNFIKNPDYPDDWQTRDYANVTAEQGKVIANAQKLEAEEVINDAISAATGPPVINETGRVLSGNSRAMSIKRAARVHLDKYKVYLDTLKEKAAQFDIDPAVIDGIDNPVLVRQVSVSDEKVPRFVELANAPSALQLDTVSKSLEIARGLPDELLERMDMEPDETLRQFISTSRGGIFSDELKKHITPNERTVYFEATGDLTDAGRTLIEDALFAKVFDADRELLEKLPKSFRRSLESALPELVHAKAMLNLGRIPQEWDIVSALTEAGKFYAENLQGVPLGHYLKQQTFVGVPRLPIDTLPGMSLRLLDEYGKNPKILRNKITRFVRAAESAGAETLFDMKQAAPHDELARILTTEATATDIGNEQMSLMGTLLENEEGFAYVPQVNMQQAAQRARDTLGRVSDVWRENVSPVGPRLLFSPESYIRRIGPASDEFATRMRMTRHQGEVWAGTGKVEAKDVIEPLSKAEQKNLSHVLDGSEAPVSPDVEAAANVIRQRLDAIADYLEQNNATLRYVRQTDVYDIDVATGQRVLKHKAGTVGYIDWKRHAGPYFPRRYSDDVLKQAATKQSIMSQWIADGQVADIAEAEQAYAFMLSSRNKGRPSKAEWARQFDVPGWEDKEPLKVLGDYYDNVYRRMAEIEQFGAKDEIKNALIDAIGKEAEAAGLPSEGKFGATYLADTLFKHYTGMYVFEVDPYAQKLSSMIRGYNAVTMMSYSFLANATQVPLNVPLYTNYKSTFKAMSEFKPLVPQAISPTKRRMTREAMMAGVLTDDAFQYMTEGRISRFFLGPFRKGEQANRILAAAAGKHFALDMNQRLISSGGTDGAAWRALERIGLDPQDLIKNPLMSDPEVDPRLLDAMKTVADKTQHRYDALDIPLWLQHPAGKTLGQFQSFNVQQAHFIREVAGNATDEMRKGNFAPMTRLLVQAGVAAPLAGNIVKNIHNIIAGRDVEPVEFTLSEYIENVSGLISIGILGETWRAHKWYGSKAGSMMLAGVPGKKLGVALDIAYGIPRGDLRTVGRAITGEVPYLGKPLKGRLFPSKRRKKGESLQRLKPVRRGAKRGDSIRELRRSRATKLMR